MPPPAAAGTAADPLNGNHGSASRPASADDSAALHHPTPNPPPPPPNDHVHLVKEVVEDGEEEEIAAEAEAEIGEEHARAWGKKRPLAPTCKRVPVEGKTIVLVRHGQSVYNEHYARTGTDPMVFDADLTPLGVEQATALRSQLAGLGIELAVTSPLRRAVRTCLLGLPPPLPSPLSLAEGEEKGKGKIRYEVWPETQELLEASCDMGDRTPHEMNEEFGPVLDFGHLPAVWWYVSGDCDPKDPEQCRRIFRTQGYIEPYDVFKRRVDALAERLKARPERVIAVFGHGDFFHTFLRLHMGVKGRWMENGDVVVGGLLA